MIVLPPLLYSAAVNMPATDFRRDFGAIGALSVLLVEAAAIWPSPLPRTQMAMCSGGRSHVPRPAGLGVVLCICRIMHRIHFVSFT